MSKHFLTIENGKLVDYIDRSETPIVVNDMKHLHKLVEGDEDIMCSSSMDFPNEHTHDAAVLDMVSRIR